MVERYRTRFLFVEIPTRVYQSLRRAVRRRCNLYGAVRDTPAPDWPWPWRRAANHGRGDRPRAGARYRERKLGVGTRDSDKREEASPPPRDRGGGLRRAGETFSLAPLAPPPPLPMPLSRTSSIRPVNDIPMIWRKRYPPEPTLTRARTHSRARTHTRTHARTYRFVSYTPPLGRIQSARTSPRRPHYVRRCRYNISTAQSLYIIISYILLLL